MNVAKIRCRCHFSVVAAATAVAQADISLVCHAAVCRLPLSGHSPRNRKMRGNGSLNDHHQCSGRQRGLFEQCEQNMRVNKRLIDGTVYCCA